MVETSKNYYRFELKKFQGTAGELFTKIKKILFQPLFGYAGTVTTSGLVSWNSSPVKMEQLNNNIATTELRMLGK